MPTLTTAWAPGRINLIGEHTDYSGGFVLPAAIQLGITVEVHTEADGITLTSTSFDDGETFASDGSGPPVHGWSRYGQAVAAELAEIGRPARGMAATIESNLPAGMGLSSSAALEVGIALALCAVADFELEPLELASVCRRAEKRAVGVPCGILDQAACLLGQDNAALLLNCSSLEHQLVPIPKSVAFLVLDSGLERRLETTGYALRRRELEHALKLVGAVSSATLSMSDLEGLDSLSQRRLRHVITENSRVLRFAAAISAGDLATVGQLMSASHASLRDDYQVSTVELDALARIAERNGAYGARMVGAGFGGAVLALVDASSASQIGAAIFEAYGGSERMPIIVRPSRGARIQEDSQAVLDASSNGLT
jgi:galactokinase